SDADEPLRVGPRFMPDNRHFLYFAASTTTLALRASSIAVPKSVTILTDLVRDSFGLDYEYANGFLLYVKDRTLFAQRLDAEALAMHGDAIQVASGVGEFSAADGVLVYHTAGAGQTSDSATSRWRLAWVNRRGERINEVETPDGYANPALSPDGR